ncbi:GNAT family N-acetyltransferase [Allopontixanthobacter sp.]|uniref:GNAT family N-acetyltransferase n=1 Tax=Allopontixanthobacter sp. TaxID=2906452 RepID=UPI002ABB7874|nr:GNAT family N-acetyltransferase [Allopontixanthobacter sp.]MDZ4308307.1 GNAT family N-acetyltransferase [Allopontixanthobacter sp.]
MTALPEGYCFVTKPGDIDLNATHAYLTRSYWAAGIPLETVRRALANSFCVAINYQGAQIAFARLVSDRATFAYLADVYVLEEHRGKGLSHAILDFLQGHPEFQGLRRWALFTRDAQGLYAAHGWKQYPSPDRMMTIDDPDVYK